MRLKGNKKGISLTVTKIAKYRRREQVIAMEDGTKKLILHYDLRKSI
jgi:hypothetical protein